MLKNLNWHKHFIIFSLIIFVCLNMEVTIADRVLIYSKQAQQYRHKYLKRHSIEQFKKISDQQIQFQYKVLSSAGLEEQTIYNKSTNKNRYIDILVYHHSRVKCNSSNNFYMNASHMKSIVDGKEFCIFAQAPTPQGMNQFWEAIYQKNVKTIVMLCNFHDPRRGRQSEQYWPDLGKSLIVKNVNLTIQTVQKQKITDDLVISHFSLKGQKGQIKVKHIHWTGWSDLKKPLGEANQNLFRNLVKQCLELIQKNEMFVIHCSAGIGRTGTLGAMIDSIRCAKKYNALSVFEIVQNLRKNRMSCVQTLQQYRFVYQQLKKYFTQ